MKKVYTIILMEHSSRELKIHPDCYIHRGKMKFDSGLELESLQEFCIIPLDIFFRIEDNKNEDEAMNELEAWLYFIGSDKPEDIAKVLQVYPEFAEMYREISYFRQHPKEALGMFSEALKILDENTAKHMVEEMRQEIDTKEQELEVKVQEIEAKDQEIEAKDQEIKEKGRELEAKDQEIERLNKLIEEMKSQQEKLS